jgi:hemerythrin-like domain-containing protein
METEDVSAVEDLMREHGLLNRLLLIYEECIHRLTQKLPINLKVIVWTAKVIRIFVEDYHEQTEEKYVFPIIQKTNPQLVKNLIEQHILGRKITDMILNTQELTPATGYKLQILLSLFVKLYRYHESREDTEAFQIFKKGLSKSDYNKYSELFEKEEDSKLGEHGFEKVLSAVIVLEKNLKINSLKSLTQITETALEKI